MTVIVTDGELFDSHYWQMRIYNYNPPPVIEAVYPEYNPTINETESQKFNVTASDPEGSPLTYSWSLDGISIGSNSSELMYNVSRFSGGKRIMSVSVTDGVRSVTHSWNLTINNTIIFFDINPSGDSNPNQFYVVGDLLFFIADDGTHGYELWVSNGTIEGTHIVKDINPGTGGVNCQYMAAMNNILYFNGYEPTHGNELWRSDGTADGTFMVLDINTGTSPSWPTYLTVMNNVLYFRATVTKSGTSYESAELWRSGGTAGNTYMVRDLYGGDNYGSRPQAFCVVGSRLYFEALTDAYSWTLCYTDGSYSGTIILPGYNIDEGWGIRKFNNKVLFTVGGKLWISDGSTSGTFSLENETSGNIFTEPYYVTILGGIFYFTANNATSGREMWRTDGTITGTQLILDIYPGSGSSCFYNSYYPTDEIIFATDVLNGIIYFEADNGTGNTLWRTDGTAVGTYSLMPGVTGSDSIDYITVAGDTIYFIHTVATNNEKLWKSDGTIEGTQLITEDDCYGKYITALGDVVYFSGFNDSTSVHAIYSSDGSVANTQVSVDNFDVDDNAWMVHFAHTANALFIVGDDGTHGIELLVI